MSNQGKPLSPEDEVQLLKGAIIRHHTKRGHDRCWENDAELYRVVGLEPGDPKRPHIEEHRLACDQYRACEYGVPVEGEPLEMLRTAKRLLEQLYAKAVIHDGDWVLCAACGADDVEEKHEQNCLLKSIRSFLWPDGNSHPLREETSKDALVYVPGDWICPTCHFRQHQRTLYAQTGDVGINHTQPDPCPNDGTPMERLTWRQDAEAANQIALDQIKYIRRLEERLYQLEPRH